MEREGKERMGCYRKFLESFIASLIIGACIKCYTFVITFKTRNKNSTDSVNLLYLSELNERRVIKVQRGFIDKRRANVGQSNICSDGRKKEATIDFFPFFQAFLVESWASFQSIKYKEKF